MWSLYPQDVCPQMRCNELGVCSGKGLQLEVASKKIDYLVILNRKWP